MTMILYYYYYYYAMDHNLHTEHVNSANTETSILPLAYNQGPY